MSYSELDRQLGLKLRNRLKIAEQDIHLATHLAGDRKPFTMDYIDAAHELVQELRRLGWREPEYPRRNDDSLSTGSLSANSLSAD